MKIIISTIIVLLILLTGCMPNFVQHRKFYTRVQTGVITDMYKNNVGGNTIVLNGKLNINVWNEDLDSTYVIGNVKTFNIKSSTRSFKK